MRKTSTRKRTKDFCGSFSSDYEEFIDSKAFKGMYSRLSAIETMILALAYVTFVYSLSKLNYESLL